MTEIVAARFGFGWGWDLNEGGWKDGVDQNFRMSDTMIGLRVINDSLTAPPGSPSDGDTYIPAATATGAWATHEGKIAAYQDGTWYFYNAPAGLRGYFVNHSEFRMTDGSTWTAESGAALPSIGPGQLIANTGTGSAVPSGVSLTALLDDVIANTQGGIIHRNGSAWAVLNKGTLGQVLTSGTADISWTDPTGAVASVVGSTGTVTLSNLVSGGVASTTAVTAAIGVETSRAEAAEALLAPINDPTFTGTITVTAPSADLHAATKKYVDDAIVGSVAGVASILGNTGTVVLSDLTSGGVASTTAVTAAIAVETTRASTAEALLAPIANPTFTGTITVTAPSADLHAATKKYVDDAVSGSVSGVASVVGNTGTVTLANLVSGGVASQTYADSAGAAAMSYADGVVGTETSRAEAAEALLAPIANPTFTGTVTVSTPSASGHAANKGYVDGAISARATLTGTAGGTLTLTGTAALNDVIINMPSAGGTVTLAASPTAFATVRAHIKQGATAGVLTLNSGFVFGASGGPSGFTITPTAAAIDMLGFISQDGTHYRVLASAQGFSS